MAALRSLLFALVFYGWTVGGPARLPDQPVRHRASALVLTPGSAIHRFCAVLSRHAHQGRRHAAPGRGLVPVKHQSMYETMEIVLMLDQPALVLKRELADIPLWGWAVRRYGNIPIDREPAARRRCRRMMRAGEAAIAEGRPIIIFPEGTRVPPGQAAAAPAGLRRPLPGLKLPVVPVAVDQRPAGAQRNSFVKRPGIVTLRFGEPIAPGLNATRSRRGSTRRSTRSSRACAWPHRGLFRPALVLGRPARGGALPQAPRLRLLPLRAQGRSLAAPALAGAASGGRIGRAGGLARRLPRLGRRFGIGLSPFELHLQPERGWQERLAAKLAALAVLKPDDLAILFDDMRGDVPDLAERQAAIVHFAAERGIAAPYPVPAPLIIRTIRSSTSPSARALLLSRADGPPARSGDPVFWTGEEVCSRELRRPSRPRRRANAAQADSVGQLSGQ